MRRPSRGPRGFTVVELMVVVVIIAVLAAVVIPSFLKSAKKARSKSEVSPMFAELMTKEEAYRTENGTYLAFTKCPSTPQTADYDYRGSCLPGTSTNLDLLRVNPTEKKLRCSYEAATYASGTVPNSAAGLVSGCTLTTTAAAQSYVVFIATCDMDGNGAPYSYYQTSTMDSTICAYNEGY